jgi:hypothetical protein
MNTTTTHTDHDPEHGIDPFAAATSVQDFEASLAEHLLSGKPFNDDVEDREYRFNATFLAPVDPVTAAFTFIDYLVDSGRLRISARPHYSLIHDDYLANRLSHEQVVATGMLDIESVMKRFGIPADEQKEAYRNRVRGAIDIINKIEVSGAATAKQASEFRAICEDFLSGKEEFSVDLSMTVESAFGGVLV